MAGMRSVGIKRLKDKLSDDVRIAASGETVLITDRDRVVAELVPPRCTRADELPAALLADLVREGVLSPAVSPRGPLPEVEGRVPLEDVIDLLSEVRSDR